VPFAVIQVFLNYCINVRGDVYVLYDSSVGLFTKHLIPPQR
jgi:hypothetical protein